MLASKEASVTRLQARHSRGSAWYPHGGDDNSGREAEYRVGEPGPARHRFLRSDRLYYSAGSLLSSPAGSHQQLLSAVDERVAVFHPFLAVRAGSLQPRNTWIVAGRGDRKRRGAHVVCLFHAATYDRQRAARLVWSAARGSGLIRNLLPGTHKSADVREREMGHRPSGKRRLLVGWNDPVAEGEIAPWTRRPASGGSFPLERIAWAGPAKLARTPALSTARRVRSPVGRDPRDCDGGDDSGRGESPDGRNKRETASPDTFDDRKHADALGARGIGSSSFAAS